MSEEQKTEKPNRATIDIRYDGPNRWQIALNGQRIEDVVAQQGLELGVDQYGMPVVRLTFLDPDLSIHLKDANIEAFIRDLAAQKTVVEPVDTKAPEETRG